MAENLTRRLIREHLVDGSLEPGEPIALRMDQTLTQDATGTLVMLEFEAMAVDRVRTQLSAQYVDHNLLQEDHKNPDDHLFLRSACHKFGVHYSPAGNGVSHPVHMERFGIPAAGALGMLAIGSGGAEVALAMAGEPLHLSMPEVWGVRLTGELPPWVSAKDVVLEMLRRHDVDGGVGRVVEYHGPGLASLSAMDRHVIANMGTELGATSTVFPSDEAVRFFLRQQGRESDWEEWLPGEGASYDVEDEIDLASLEPLVAMPQSPGNVKPVREVAGEPIYQAYVGSSANPGLRDFAVPALMVQGRQVHDRVSFDVNPTSRQILETLVEQSYLGKLIHAGARIHQAGCNGCIGMGQAPATDRISLRTVPRNFPGRSGTHEDQVYLCSPETATASALTGVITDPRDLDLPWPGWSEPESIRLHQTMIGAPREADETDELELAKGPNITSLPELEPLPDRLEGPVLLKVGDDISTDEIMPAGARILPFRSNIPEISKFVFQEVDPGYPERALEFQDSGSFVVGGENYGQGSSREHAALAPRYLGLRAVIAKSFARIHRQNLANFGILPLLFVDGGDYDAIERDDRLSATNLREAMEQGRETLSIRNETKDTSFDVRVPLSPRQRTMVLAGSILALAGSGSSS